MASDNPSSEDQIDASHAPRECMPCRGSGRVISNLGGTPSQLDCPWCGGGGIRSPDRDAQAAWLERRAGEAPSDPPPQTDAAASSGS